MFCFRFLLSHFSRYKSEKLLEIFRVNSRYIKNTLCFSWTFNWYHLRRRSFEKTNTFLLLRNNPHPSRWENISKIYQNCSSVGHSKIWSDFHNLETIPAHLFALSSSIVFTLLSNKSGGVRSGQSVSYFSDVTHLGYFCCRNCIVWLAVPF